MIIFPNAKINIGLNIIRKREDGYHDIESLMYPLTGIVFDALELVASPPSPLLKEKGAKLMASGIAVPGNAKQNLCVRAYNLIRKDNPMAPSIEIHLHKAIPIGAGLGGGSADAAFFIRLLNEKFELKISSEEMCSYARRLGSDCAFFIANRPAFAEARGDIFEPIKVSLAGYHVAVVCPPVHVSTAEAYAGVTPKEPERGLQYDLETLPVTQWKKYVHNDFEDSVFRKYPEIKKIKEKLYSLGALYASMSGSGSAVYGIFKKEPGLKNKFGKMKVWEGKLS